MASRRGQARLRQRLRRSLLPVAPALAAAGLAVASLAGGGAPARATPEAPPSYAALAAPAEPTGLALVDPHAAEAPATGGPTWPASPPVGTGGSWPVTATIRRLKMSGVQAWIARSAAGGVCLMLYDGRRVEGVAAVDVSCSSAEAFGDGASIEVAEIPGMPGRVIEAGVVPDGVTAVRTALADGTSATTAVTGNAWTRSGSEPPAPGSEPTAITRG
jgi:hypothetical protein